MANNRKHSVYKCLDCENQFITTFQEDKNELSCPFCNRKHYVEKVRDFWTDSLFIFQRKKYTEAEDRIIIESIKAGISRQNIAIELERTRESINKRVERLRKAGLI